MNTTAHPIRTTIGFGLICGLAFIPLVIGFGFVIAGKAALCFTLWINLAAYSLLMVHWSKKGITLVLFPLLLALMTIFGEVSVSAFLLIAMGIFSWIRSGICYPTQFKRRLVSETILGIAAWVLIGSFSPISLINWAMAIWMFFLVQALYFVFFEDHLPTGRKHRRDAFEQAREQAEKILSAGL
jgi:hypothetical protein